MNKDILICGVGGQGTVLASKLIASAAMSENNIVHSAETIGMAQRGGSVTSHVRIGQNAFSPLIPDHCADLILSFEPAEAVRNLKFLKKDGAVIVNSQPIKPITETLDNTGYDGSNMIEYLKQLANEMTKFLRWCLYKAEKSRPSIFALVLPSTFAQNESFVNARKYLVEHVSEMWILDFDVDNRAGHNAENLFNTLQ